MNFKINDRLIGIDQPPFIVAELSANHNGSLERALKTIEDNSLVHINIICGSLFST